MIVLLRKSSYLRADSGNSTEWHKKIKKNTILAKKMTNKLSKPKGKWSSQDNQSDENYKLKIDENYKQKLY